MNSTIPIMSELFRGIPQEEGSQLMSRLGATIRHIPKGGIVLHAGELKRNMGILLDGRLEMFEIDSQGRRSMVGEVRPPQTFAQIFAFARVERHPATVLAVEDSTIMVVPLSRILPRPGAEIDAVYSRFIQNMIGQICEQAWALRYRAFILSRRSTEERLTTYLRQQMNVAGNPSFRIPFDRQGLADYLCVDRSALSSVMSKMAKRGLMTYRKNHFVLKEPLCGADADTTMPR